MQNAAVAAVFDEIADLMEIAGENSFKTRAYRRAADAVTTSPTPIEEAAESGTLQNIEGIGEATSAKIREFLATGSVRYLERLRDEFPPGLRDLSRVPGLGPKRVAQLYAAKQIGSVEELNEALEKNTLVGVSGFGPKTIEHIKKGLQRMAQMSKRLPIGEALPLAESIAAALRDAAPEATKVEIAGSLRRGSDTVGNLNFIAETKEPASVIEKFVGLSYVLAVTDQSTHAARVRVRPGIEVQLFTSIPQQFGTQFVRATGSAAHMEEAAKAATDAGLDLQENGLFRAGKPVAVRDVKSFYKLLGVPFIEPELRENRGEWAAAQQNKLPKLIQLGDLRGDLHSHSTWSDGRVSIREMTVAMQARGYEYFAVTDHSRALAMANGLDAARLREQAKEIAEVQAEFPNFKILRGIECDIMRDGTLDLDDDILHELDIVIASIHSGFALDEKSQTERVLKAIAHPAVDIIAHPTGRVLGVRPGYEINIPAVIEAAAEYATCLEINSSERLDLSDENAFAAREAGVLLSINSDAHSPRGLPSVELGVLSARRAWCEKQDVLNTKTTKQLLQWLERPQAQPI